MLSISYLLIIMNASDEPNEIEINSFRQTQFLFYLIPCYYGVVALIYRYYALLQIQPSYYVSHIPGESILKNIEPQQERGRNSQTMTYRILTASYVIKSKLCLFNSYLYLFMVVLSFVCTPTMFYSANHKVHSFLYLFGALAWYLAALVLRREQQRGMSQSIWIHRLFWILAGTFSVYKMFQDYFLPLNLIVNICLIISNLVLALYGIYRPEDNDTLIMVVSDDIPGFVKVAFQKLQLNDRIRSWFGIQDQTNQNLAEDNIIKPEIDNQDLQIIGKVLKRSAESIKTEINLLNELPRRNVFVDKKVRYVRAGQKVKSCYFILTQVGNSRFQSQRSLQEFRNLYQSLTQVFTPQNFPKHQLPRPVGLLGNDAEENLSDNLQTWFEEILKTPIFITKQILQFLNVDTQKSAPFITYFQNSYSSFCSRHFILLKHNKRKQLDSPLKEKNQTTELAGYYNRQIKTHVITENQKILSLLKYELSFTVSAEALTEEQDGIKFGITCVIDRKRRLTWDLKKRFAGLPILNQKIQQECNCLIPFYYSLVASNLTKQKVKIIQNCKIYIQTLLNTKKYYCTALFTYILFDIVKQEVITSEGAPLNFQLVNTQQRKSRYIEQYEDKGGFIEVLRIDRVEPSENGEDLFKFKLRRKQLTLVNKTTEDLKHLRQKLVEIYRGVSFVPEVKFKNSSKLQVKNKIETFLLKIQNLPRIQIIKEYKFFYGNSLNRQ